MNLWSLLAQIQAHLLAFIQNPVGVTILMTVLAGGYEYFIQRSRGPSKKGAEYRVWAKLVGNNVLASSSRSIEEIIAASDLADFQAIEPLARMRPLQFASLSIDLIFGAFTVDLISVLEKKSTSVLFSLFFLHIIATFLVLGCLISVEQSYPNQYIKRNSMSMFAIVIGIISLILAFLILPGIGAK